MLPRDSFSSFAQNRLAFVLLAMFFVTLTHAGADTVAVPISLSIDPAVVLQGDDQRTVLKTTVTLQAPSPGYFICEVRSKEKRKLECTSIIFKKGDTEGQGVATIYWDNVKTDSTVKVSAFNVDTPDTVVSFTVKLQVKVEGNP